MQHDKFQPDPSLREKPPASNGDSSEDDPYADDEARASSLSVDHRRGTGFWVVIGVLLLAVGLAVAWFVTNHRRGTADSSLETETAATVDAAPPVDVVPVQYASSSHTLTLPGETRAWYETMIYARVSGYVKKWNVDIGDKVHDGQVLATIETPELDQQLAAVLGKVEAAKAQVKLSQATAHFSEVTYARYKDAPKGMVSDLERDQKQADYQTSLARVTSAESDLNSAQAEVDQLRAMLAFKQVTAPFDGVIAERRVDIGDLVTAGSTASTTSLFKIVQPDPMRVFVDVPQQMAVQLHDGDEASVTAQEYPGRKFDGRIARNARAINAAAKTLHVEVDVPNHDFVLLSGMYVQVNFQINDRHPSLQVPASAMNFRSGGPQVAVVSKDGRVAFRDVTISKDMGNLVEIGTGLAPNERVALNISNQVAEGDKVNAIDVDSPGAPSTVPTRAVTSAAAAESAPHISARDGAEGHR